MKERPILFSGPMVRAILDGRKTQTRRVVKPQPVMSNRCGIPFFPDGSPVDYRLCPYGADGDRLWVRETFLNNALPGYPPVWFYRADGNDKPHDRNWKPSIFCTREASRITLEVTGVRVERLNEISEDDAHAEGCPANTHFGTIETPKCSDWFRSLWQSINGPGSWAENPWVWVVEFKRLEGGGK